MYFENLVVAILIGVVVMAAIVIAFKVLFPKLPMRPLALLSGAMGALTALQLRNDPFALEQIQTQLVGIGILFAVAVLKLVIRAIR